MNIKYKAFVLASLIFLLLMGFMKAFSESVMLPFYSSAVCDDAMAVIINPAGLGVKRGLNGYYYHTLSGATGGDNAFFISLTNLGFGAEFVDQAEAKFSKYTLSDSLRLTNDLYFGAGYSWYNSKHKIYDSLSSWDAGLLYRPSNYISFGMTAHNINRSENTKRNYNLAIGLRPYTNRVTFSMDGMLTESSKIKDADIRWSIELEPVNGMLLKGSYGRDRSFDIKVGIGLPRLEFGSYRHFDDNGTNKGGGVYTRFSNERFRTIFDIGNYVLDINTEDINEVQKAKDDVTIEGIIIKPSMNGSGMASIQEMYDSIAEFKSTGKKSLCYIDMISNKGYYLASISDKIVINRAGYLLLNGLRSEVTLYKGTLDKLGIEAELYNIGKYKSASEILTNERISDYHRESLNSILDDLSEQMVSGIADGLGITKEKVQELIDMGPYSAKSAEKVGLVDSLVYADQVEEEMKQLVGKKVTIISGKEYGKRKYYNYNWGIKPQIAVIYATGLIVPGKSTIDGIMGADTICNALKKAREDRLIKAVVIRIDSGGGSVFASDLIWREVVLTKRKKPVIVSMGDIAASGGYYIACPADVILAEPSTITGSIGVISGKINLRGFYDRLGIKKEILKRGRNSDIYSLYTDFSDEQKEIIERQAQETYKDFVAKVVEGRKLSEEQVEKIAQGRVWTGRQAKENGLIDELGGLDKAISIAKKKANIKEDTSVDIISLPKPSFLFRQFVFEELFILRSLRYFEDLEEKLSRDKLFFLMPSYYKFE